MDLSLQKAIEILREELLKHGDLYHACIESMKSALKDLDDERRVGLDLSPDDYDEIPEKMLNHIIGEE